MQLYEVTTMGELGDAAAAPAPTPVSTQILDPVVVSVDGRIFALAVIGAVGAGVWWAWKRTKKR